MTSECWQAANEGYAYYYGKEYIHKVGHESFRIRSYFLQSTLRVSAALGLQTPWEPWQLQSCKYTPEFGSQHLKIVFGNTADHCHAYRAISSHSTLL